MDQYNTIELNDNEYYLATDIKKFNKNFFYGTNNNVRNIVKKKDIQEDDYIHAYQKKGKWVISDQKYCRAKLLLSKEWCMDNVPKFAKHSKVVAELEDLPPLLDLEDDEKFTDGEYIYDITIRGERDMDNCYFSVEDVGDLFEFKNLSNDILDNRKGYEYKLHYKIFTYEKNAGRTKSKSRIYKTKYFTYTGLLRCLFVSRNKNAERFQKWASSILFTHQFGTQEDKDKLASKLLGVHHKAVREVFKASSTTIPCVYLFTLGTAKQLRKSMKLPNTINDDQIICKYGMTESLERRTYEHNRTFSKIKKTDLHLKYYAYIDPQYVSEAETDMGDYFAALNANIEFKDMKELVALSSKQMNGIIKKQYTNLSNLYAGHVKDLISKIKTLEDKLKLQEQIHKNEMLEMEKQLIEKDNEITILKKDNEINIMKLELEMLRNRNK